MPFLRVMHARRASSSSAKANLFLRQTSFPLRLHPPPLAHGRSCSTPAARAYRIAAGGHPPPGHARATTSSK
eukprot:scaffold3741_cov114-Isochrysis_galbana.AAC.10